MSPVLGTDGKRHVVYELQLTNAKPVPATLQEIQVLDAARPAAAPIAAFIGDDLRHRLRTLTGHTLAVPTLAEDVSRLVLVDLTFAPDGPLPATLIHRLKLTGQPVTGGTTPAPLDYTAAPFDIFRTPPPVLGPPLAGKGWVVLTGCCGSDSIHRNTVLPVNGHLSVTQGFAIDYMRLDGQGRLVHSDAGDVHNYTAYGAPILTVAEGTVVSARGTLPDQLPGSLPDPSTITLDTVDGNHAVLDLGGGNFAF
jgi:hypothetical protein